MWIEPFCAGLKTLKYLSVMQDHEDRPFPAVVDALPSLHNLVGVVVARCRFQSAPLAELGLVKCCMWLRNYGRSSGADLDRRCHPHHPAGRLPVPPDQPQPGA